MKNRVFRLSFLYFWCWLWLLIMCPRTIYNVYKGFSWLGWVFVVLIEKEKRWDVCELLVLQAHCRRKIAPRLCSENDLRNFILFNSPCVWCYLFCFFVNKILVCSIFRSERFRKSLFYFCWLVFYEKKKFHFPEHRIVIFMLWNNIMIIKNEYNQVKLEKYKLIGPKIFILIFFKYWLYIRFTQLNAIYIVLSLFFIHTYIISKLFDLSFSQR